MYVVRDQIIGIRDYGGDDGLSESTIQPDFVPFVLSMPKVQN